MHAQAQANTHYDAAKGPPTAAAQLSQAASLQPPSSSQAHPANNTVQQSPHKDSTQTVANSEQSRQGAEGEQQQQEDVSMQESMEGGDSPSQEHAMPDLHVSDVRSKGHFLKRQ